MNNSIIASNFASALDKEDYTVASEYIDSSCEYQLNSGILYGQEAIVNSYKEASEWARKNLDSVTYENEIKQISESEFIITFSDFITHNGKKITYISLQRITINPSGKIIIIKNEIIAKKKEELERFFQKVKVKRA